MRTTQHQDTLPSKQRLRTEISDHVDAFLHKGGRIEVVEVLSPFNHSTKTCHRPASVELALISNLLDE